MLLPLVKPAVVGALVYGFVRSVTTVSAVIFLVSGDTDMATTYIIGRVVNGDYGVAIAYSAVLILSWWRRSSPSSGWSACAWWPRGPWRARRERRRGHHRAARA